MADEVRNRLRLIISVALAMVPRSVRRQYADNLTLTADVGKDRIADSVLATFDLAPREPTYGPPLGSVGGVEIKGGGDR